MSDNVYQFAKALNVLGEQKCWSTIQAYLHSQQSLHFDKSAKGGEFRGEKWEYFKPQYIRLDGTEVPVWGGIPKEKGEGMVEAAIRTKSPLKYYKPDDHLMQNTGRLRNALLSEMRVSENQITLITPVNYAKEQDAMRPFNFLTETDIQFIERSIAREIANGIQRN